MKILVTGGAGFAGSNFIRLILKKYPNYQVVNLDKLTYAGNLENLKDIEGNSNYQFVKGDIADQRTVFKICRNGRIDAIVNYAAETHVDRSILDPDAFVKTDVIGTYNLLEAVKQFAIGKMVQISTDEVFGSIEKGKFNENSPLEPNSPYSASKACAELLVRAYIRTFGMDAVITRCSNNYGPNQDVSKLIPKAIVNILTGKKVPIYGNGQHVRDWIYVEDHVDAIDIVFHRGRGGGIYNIGGGAEHKNIDIIKKIASIAEIIGDHIEFIEDRKGHDFRYAIDNSGMKEEFGWEPKVRLDDGLAKTVYFYKKRL